MDKLKHGVKLDRLTGHHFKPNFYQLILHTAAINLLNALRDHSLRKVHPHTWRGVPIKVAATVILSIRRVVVKLSDNWPW